MSVCCLMPLLDTFPCVQVQEQMRANYIICWWQELEKQRVIAMRDIEAQQELERRKQHEMRQLEIEEARKQAREQMKAEMNLKVCLTPFGTPLAPDPPRGCSP